MCTVQFAPESVVPRPCKKKALCIRETHHSPFAVPAVVSGHRLPETTPR